MASNICKKSGLASFHSPRIKLKKTAFFKGSRGISPLKTNENFLELIFKLFKIIKTIVKLQVPLGTRKVIQFT